MEQAIPRTDFFDVSFRPSNSHPPCISILSEMFTHNVRSQQHIEHETSATTPTSATFSAPRLGDAASALRATQHPCVPQVLYPALLGPDLKQWPNRTSFASETRMVKRLSGGRNFSSGSDAIGHGTVRLSSWSWPSGARLK